MGWGLYVDVEEQTTVDVGQHASPILGALGKGFSSSSQDRAGDKLISFLAGF